MFVRTLFSAAVAVVLVAGVGAAEKAAVKSGPQVGEDLAGPFHPLNINGKSAGKKNCLYCENGQSPVAINMSTSRVVEDLAKQFGVPCYRSAVGEANVVAKMREVGAVLGGEGNGGVIDPRVGWVRDPFIGMGLVLNLMAETGRKLSELAAELPAYAIVKEKYEVARERLPGLFGALERRWPSCSTRTRTGWRSSTKTAATSARS